MNHDSIKSVLEPGEEFSPVFTEPLLVGKDGAVSLITLGSKNVKSQRVRIEAHLVTPGEDGPPDQYDLKWGTLWEVDHMVDFPPRYSTRSMTPGAYVRGVITDLVPEKDDELAEVTVSVRTNPEYSALYGGHAGSILSSVIGDGASSYTTDTLVVGSDGMAVLTMTDFEHVNNFDIAFEKNVVFKPGDINLSHGWSIIPGLSSDDVTPNTPETFVAKDLLPGTRVRAVVSGIQYANSEGKFRINIRTGYGKPI